ncbi:MAG TPA: hypothetical protein VN649_07775 [Ramlibacter sp.]|nr:hypothetical protein [Ramlibacter sp.]
MGGIGGGRDDNDLSWTNEELPLEVRRALLDKALEDMKAERARAKVPGTSDRAGKTGSERDPAGVKDKPSA